MKKTAFTLVEILVVIALLIIFVTAAFMVLNPASRVEAAAKSQIQQDVRTVLNAMNTYTIDHRGVLPRYDSNGDSTTDSELPVVALGSEVGAIECEKVLDLIPKYVSRIPIPANGGSLKCGQLTNGQVQVTGYQFDDPIFVLTN